MINDTGSDNNTVDELIDNIYEEVAQLVDKYRERFRGGHNTTTDSEDLSATQVCYTDECGEPCRSYVASLWAERDAARKAAGVAGERLGKERAKVAAVQAQRDRWKAAWEMALPLLTERDELAAKVARVEALADEWEQAPIRHTYYLRECAADLRAALSAAPTDTTKETP